ncbi:hypothetical protein N9382_00035 [bacterium]|nr:hypothetical protein [bacterium]
MKYEFLKKGVSSKFQLLPKETILGINNNLSEKLSYLNSLVKNSCEKKKIDETVKEIWFDEKILELNNDIYFKDLYIPIISEITGINKLTKFTDATFFVRVNLPKIDDFYAKWHQDAGTFLYSNQTAYNYKSYAIWCSLTKSTAENSLEFVSKENYQEQVYNSKFKKSKRHGGITFDHSVLPFDEKKVEKINLDFNSGEAVVFDSLVYHRTVRKSDKIRVSFDLRLFSREEKEKIMKRAFIPKLKRYIYTQCGFKSF